MAVTDVARANKVNYKVILLFRPLVFRVIIWQGRENRWQWQSVASTRSVNQNTIIYFPTKYWPSVEIASANICPSCPWLSSFWCFEWCPRIFPSLTPVSTFPATKTKTRYNNDCLHLNKPIQPNSKCESGRCKIRAMCNWKGCPVKVVAFHQLYSTSTKRQWSERRWSIRSLGSKLYGYTGSWWSWRR